MPPSPASSPSGPAAATTPPDARRAAARAWFEALRDRIRAELEALEHEAGSVATFAETAWDRPDPSGAPGGGGVMSTLRGRVFEKAGVNVSTVQGRFSPEFAGQVNGASRERPEFHATGISLVLHPANPHVPAVHMNTRYLETTVGWFGGTTDLNPAIPIAQDTRDFHDALRTALGEDRYARWSDEASRYYFLPHRGVERGVGGVFYDHLSTGDWEADFAVTRAVGETFLAIYPLIARRRMHAPASEADRARQLEYRGRYVEFNLLHDRGTLFGLKTGGNIDAILMSLPPLASWR
jgi:coproporphyrinogen III oxidase